MRGTGEQPVVTHRRAIGDEDRGVAPAAISRAGAEAGSPQPGGLRDYTIACAECDTPATYPAYRCTACDGPLVAQLADVVEGSPMRATGIWRRRGILPRTHHAVTLGEGETPLVPLLLGSEGRGYHLYAKLESLNPTLSFKDRAMALASSIALDLGLHGLVLASSGNAAVSAAAYAAAAGLDCTAYCGLGSRAGTKLTAARGHGAAVCAIDGDYSAAYAAAAGAERGGWLNVTTTYRNPLLAEAYRPIAYELLDDLGRLPDVVVVPIGAGPLLRGLLGGFADLLRGGLADRVPRLVGVQATACAPLARAWIAPDWLASLNEGTPVGATSAAAIADSLRGYEREGLLTLDAVRRSGGQIVAVDEAAIEESRRLLAMRCGLLVEPATATAVAALAHPSVAGMLGPESTVVAILTGHGSKEPPELGAPPPLAEEVPL